MRLLQRLPDDNGFSLVYREGNDIPPYAILSHTWGSDNDEVTFKEITEGEGKGKTGYHKLSFCSKQAARDGLDFFWVDTCCIDKTSSAELTEAINSMYKWYQKAKRCYVFLTDVSIDFPTNNVSPQTWATVFQDSRWFKRGWTLQELLASRSVDFFSKHREWCGDKTTLSQALHITTRIPVAALQGTPLSQFSVEERMSWARDRETKREEDSAYSLFGMFDVQLPLLYGEGRGRAMVRLRREIQGLSSSYQLIPSSVPRFSTIPFKRDDDFVDRDSLRRVCQICAQPAGRAALVGLGGIGKSQIAIEFAHRMRSELPGKSVFWVHAGTRARFEDGYRRIAQMTKMAGWDDPREDILRLVHDWLCDESNGQWTLVVDNADDASLLFYNRSRSHTLPNPDQSTQLLSKFLPQSPNGSILLTSRSHDVGQRFTDSYSSVVEVKPMEDNDALALLEKKLPSKIIRQEAIQLIHTLDAMPLALTQAAAYITRRAPRMSILRYLEEIRKSERDRAHLLETDLGDNRRDVHASNSIIATWQISFEYIRKQTPSATRLLSLISMFDRQAIPESLLQDRYRSDSEGEVHFEDDMATLSNFSLIKTNEDGSEFEMHRLVQFSTKKWLEYNGEQEEWTSVYSMLMDASFPLGEYENWTVCRALLPHVQSLKDNKPADKQGLIAWASVLYKTAWYMIEMGQYSDALQLNITAVEVRNRVLGVEHAHTLDCHNDIGRALRAQGKYTKAELVHAEALRVRSRVLGQDHSDTLRSMHNLAETYQTQGRWDDAQKLQVQVVEKRKIKLGEDHSETLISLNCLAGIYQSQGRWDEAEKLQIQVVEKSRNKLGEDHPDTLISIDNLAGMYKRQRRWDEAEKLQIEVVEKSKKIIGVDHPSTLTSMGNLSRTYCNRGWWDGAEELQVWVKEKRKIKLGEDHPDTLQSMSNLAVTWHAQGRNVEALELMQDCVQRSRRVLGDSHPETVDFWYYLEMWELESVPSD